MQVAQKRTSLYYVLDRAAQSWLPQTELTNLGPGYDHYDNGPHGDSGHQWSTLSSSSNFEK